ncbi:MAG: Bax inhibitor-1/YccA family protein [Bacteroidota bacterium]
MKFGRSNNPMFSEKAIAKAKAETLDGDMYGNDNRGGGIILEETMTVSGAVNKTIMLTMVMLVVALYSYTNPLSIFMTVGALGAFVVYLFTSFKPQYSPITAPIFALLEGLFVGTISAVYAHMFEGIIIQAVTATVGVLITMLMVHRSGLIPVTQKFRMGVSMAVGAIMLLYLVSWIGHFVGFQIPYIHEGGAIGIGITVVIIGIAALNLLLDFDNFEKGEQAGAPKFMEWYFGMGLLFTLVWLYVEFLRLISKLQRD